MSAPQQASSSGIGLGGLLTVMFVAFKLSGTGAVADWSWWWVLSPLWIPLAFVLVFGLVASLIGMVLR